MENYISEGAFTTVLSIVVLLIVMFGLYKMLGSEDGGKLVVARLQKNKITISEVFLVVFAFFEGLTAAESSQETGFYGIRLSVHVFIALLGAHIAMISIREFMDAIEKTASGKHSIIYIIVQWFQAIGAFIVGNVIPVANLWIIASGTGELGLLFRGKLIQNGTLYSLGPIERFEYTSQIVTASAVMVSLHIAVTFLIALWVIDDLKTEDAKDTKSKESKDDKSKDGKKEKGDGSESGETHHRVNLNHLISYLTKNKLLTRSMSELSHSQLKSMLLYGTGKNEEARERLERINDSFAKVIEKEKAFEATTDGGVHKKLTTQITNLRVDILSTMKAQWEFQKKG